MNSNVLSERAKRFEAWKKLLSKVQVRPQNPFHEFGDYRKSKQRHELEFTRLVGSELSDELAAWDAATDDDLEAFESSLDDG